MACEYTPIENFWLLNENENEEKLYFNNLSHFFGIHFKIHDTVGY